MKNLNIPTNLSNLDNIVKTGYGSYGYVVKKSAKTSQVVELTGYDKTVRRFKNRYLSDHGLEPLTKENAHMVSTIISIKSPEWGTKTFTYHADGNHTHTHGQACLWEDEFKFWLVASFK